MDSSSSSSSSSSSLRYPFVSCEIFTCEIEVILKTLVEDDKVFFHSLC